MLASAAVAAALFVVPATAAAADRTSINVDAAHEQGTVDPSVLGHAYLWPFGGMGSYDEQAGAFYPSFLDQLRNGIRPGAIRYPGGITGETFHWRRSVGPQSQRTPSAFAPNQGPSDPTVGPDEFGQLLDATGARGVMTVNFATGSAKEAADLAAHMRGHDIPYWEVGNEENLAKYWRGGQAVSVGGPAGACQQVATCLYIYGGSTRFTRQAAVGYADRRPDASYSTGAPDQSFYVQYPPVAPDPGSTTVYVDGEAWTQVDDLGSAAPGAPVYAVEPQSGKVTFGDGQHGAVPPQGAKVTISYVSGPHDGFLDFLHAIKAVDPQAKVCSSDPTTDFIQSMGSALPYDCLEHHPYVGSGDVPNGEPVDQYERDLMAVPDQEGASASALHAQASAAAGRDVPLVLTEYGQLLSSNPDGQPFFHDSLDEALLNASQLAQWIRLGIPVADRQLLTAEIPPDGTPCCPGLPGAAPFATTGAIGTPGPDSVLEATGQVYGLFAPLGGQGRLPVQLTGNPALTGSAAHALEAVAVRGPDSMYLLVINRSPTDAVAAHVDPADFRHDATADVTTLNGASSLSYNSPSDPNAVSIADRQVVVGAGGFDHTFPAHSVSAIRLHGQVAPNAPELSMSSAAPVVDAGDTTTATATLRNDTDATITGTLSASGPDGWTVTPNGSATYTLAAGEKTTRTFTVQVPADAPAGPGEIAATASGYGITLARATTAITVPSSFAAALNNAGTSDDANVDGADFDGVGNSYSRQALAAAGLAPGATVSHDGVDFKWPDAPAGQPDNVVAQGQTIAVSGRGAKLAFLGASSSAPTATGSGTVYYTDGSTSSYSLTLYGFFNAPPGTADDVIAELPYENSQGVAGRPRGQYAHPVYVFYASAPVDAGKTVVAVTLPTGGSTGPGRVKGMHFFAAGLG